MYRYAGSHCVTFHQISAAAFQQMPGVSFALQPVERARQMHIDHFLPLPRAHLLDHRGSDNPALLTKPCTAPNRHGLVDRTRREIGIRDTADDAQHLVPWKGASDSVNVISLRSIATALPPSRTTSSVVARPMP